MTMISVVSIITTFRTRLLLSPHFATALLALSSSHSVFGFTTCSSSSAGVLATSSSHSVLQRFRRPTLFSSSTVVDPVVTTTKKMINPKEKLDALRQRMKEANLDVWIVPTDDPHLSEYVPAAYKRREYLTGFKGSAGTAVITSDQALLWTDSRYWNEAGLQLDATLWKLEKAGLPDTKTIPKWIADFSTETYTRTQQPVRVGIDSFVHPASFAKELETAWKEAAQEAGLYQDPDDTNGSTKTTAGSEVVAVGLLETNHGNLVDSIWGEDRPMIPKSPFSVHPLEFAGTSIAEKIEAIRKEMTSKKATLTVFSALDDVAYVLNLRAQGDIDTCPVGIAYATVSLDQITLYCDPSKVQSDDVKLHLADIIIKPYDDVVHDIVKHVQDNKLHKVWMDKSKTNCAIATVVPERQLIDAQNAVTPMKACKNDAEMQGMRQAHIVDGAAMAKFMAWLEKAILEEGRSVSEVEIDERLTACRAEQVGFKEVSFPTIAGVGSNGAIVHYRAAEGSELLKYLDKESPILLDSGAQYTYGTTDVTRTWHFGEPTQEFMDCYTRVLKGHIGLDQMVFPENTPGFVLDVFARRWLWDIGKDYGHGTGHGVGAALNVHEGPMSISPRWTNKEVLKKGMVVSNEPGYYDDGKFGIRIENLLEIKYVRSDDDRDQSSNNGEQVVPKNGQKKFLKFAKLTMIPIQMNLINMNLMTESELDWLDSYHEEVFEKVSPLLPKVSPEMAWLERKCSKIVRNI